MTLEHIWQAYGSQLRRWLQSRVSDADDVDDLLQEVLIRTHQNISDLKDTDKLSPWLFSIARNAVIDLYRQRGRKSGLNESDLWYLTEDPDSLAELSDCILPFIEQLPDQTAGLLKAVDIQGRSQKECAEELGISYSALKSRVQRGRQQLAAVFRDCCLFELDSKGNVIGYERRNRGCKGC